MGVSFVLYMLRTPLTSLQESVCIIVDVDRIVCLFFVLITVWLSIANISRVTRS